MTKRLILMRHAKSDWDDPLLEDIDRPLNARGRDSAAALGKWLAQHGFLPDEVVSSSAVRTRETLERLALKTDASFKPELYLAAAGTMLGVLKGCEGDSVLMVGHNPGIADLAEALLGVTPDHSRFLDYPTGATLVCDLPIQNWAEAVPRSAQFVDFVVPRDLIS